MLHNIDFVDLAVHAMFHCFPYKTYINNLCVVWHLLHDNVIYTIEVEYKRHF